LFADKKKEIEDYFSEYDDKGNQVMKNKNTFRQNN